MKKYSQKVKDYIQENFKGVGHKEMAERLTAEFGIIYTASQIKSYYGNHGLNSGLTGRYEKGNHPHNKGKKGCAPGSEKGWFKKGQTPKNHKPVGSERIVNKDGYHLMKTAEPNIWRLKHQVLWEQANGEIPRGHIVIFLDGNKDNITLKNLALVSKSENARLNQSKLRSTEPSLTQTGILIARLKTHVGKKVRETK